MRLDEFHHAIRAARDVLTQQGGSGALVVMGSQSILAAFPPAALDSRLLMSAEVDVMPVAAEANEVERLSDYLHGALGQDSYFQETHGFHVDGITIETSVLHNGWVDRLVPEIDPASGAVGWCLDPHDLAVAKLIAGRPKDVDFVAVLVETRLVDSVVIRNRLLLIEDDRRRLALARIDALSPRGLPEADRVAWSRRREHALRDRRSKVDEPSPADVLRALLAAD